MYEGSGLLASANLSHLLNMIAPMPISEAARFTFNPPPIPVLFLSF